MAIIGQQQDDTQEHEAPVGVPTRERDALHGHRHDHRADGAAERRAVAAGEQRPADDGGDDVLELLTVTGVGLERVEAEGQQHPDQPRRSRHEHEELGLGAGGGHADLAGASLLPPTANVQMPNLREPSTHVVTAVNAENHTFAC